MSDEANTGRIGGGTKSVVVSDETKNEVPENGSGGEIVGFKTMGVGPAATVEELSKYKILTPELEAELVSLRQQVLELEAAELRAMGQLADDHAKFVEATDILVKENERLKAENVGLKTKVRLLKNPVVSSPLDIGATTVINGVPRIVTRQESARDVVEHILKRNVPEDSLVLVLERVQAGG